MNRFISRRVAKRGALGLSAMAIVAFGAAEAQDAMRMYYVDDPVGRNVVMIQSDAQLETMLTTTNDIRADIGIDPKNVLNNPRARFTINIASLDTGIAVRNEHMLSPAWMDAAKFPTATFELTRVVSPTAPTPLQQGVKARGEVEGNLTLHGVTKPVRAQLEIETLAENDVTKTRLPGDLMHIRARFPLTLSDFAINVPAPAQLKIAATQQVTVDVFSSTQKQAAPATAAAQKPATTVGNNANQGTIVKPAQRSMAQAATGVNPVDNELKIEDVTIGTGAEAVAGKKVTVHYRGTLQNGTEFDASYKRNEPFQFTLGAGEVIKGWDEGFAGMKVGGKRKLTIPPAMGYGARGAGGVIPPNATLNFEVELLKVG